MLQPEAGHRFTQPHRFGWIQCPNAFVEVDVAVGAGACAARPHDQKGGCSPREAFPDVRAAGFLADRVELEVKKQVGNSSDAFPLRGFDAQPVRFQN